METLASSLVAQGTWKKMLLLTYIGSIGSTRISQLEQRTSHNATRDLSLAKAEEL